MNTRRLKIRDNRPLEIDFEVESTELDAGDLNSLRDHPFALAFSLFAGDGNVMWNFDPDTSRLYTTDDPNSDLWPDYYVTEITSRIKRKLVTEPKAQWYIACRTKP